MNRKLWVLLALTATLAFATGPVPAAEETVYFEESFENRSIGSVVYQTDFETGTDGWSGWVYVYLGENFSETHRQRDSTLRTTGRAKVGSGRWDRYQFHQRRSIEVDEAATYHVFVRSGFGFPDRPFDDHQNYDRLEVDGRKLPLEDGIETHHRLDLAAGNHTFDRVVEFEDSDGGVGNGSVTVDRFALIRDSRRHVGIWKSDGFPMYTAAGIDGVSLYTRSVSASINASPAQRRDPVTLAFDVRTTSAAANWSVEQSGHTVAVGSVHADHQRRIRRQISLQGGRFTFEIDSRDTVAIDNLQVVGYQGTSGRAAELEPGVPIIGRAAPEQGYETLIGGLDGILDLGLDTATYLALIGLALGSVLFAAGRHRDDRGPVLVLGGVALLISVLVFAPLLDTVAWVFAGNVEQPSLEEPDLSATSVLYRTDFDAGSLADSDWRQITGRPSNAYLDASDGGPSSLVLREGAIVETTVPLDGSGVDAGVLSVASRVESTVGQAPPDEDALSLILQSDGSTVVDDRSAVVSTGGDSVDRTVQRRVTLSGSNITIRLGARDTNGGDGRARVTVDRVSLRGAP